MNKLNVKATAKKIDDIIAAYKDLQVQMGAIRSMLFERADKRTEKCIHDADLQQRDMFRLWYNGAMRVFVVDTVQQESLRHTLNPAVLDQTSYYGMRCEQSTVEKLMELENYDVSKLVRFKCIEIGKNGKPTKLEIKFVVNDDYYKQAVENIIQKV